MGEWFEKKLDLEISKVSLGKYKIGLLRLDLSHPEMSGNKWFKLKYNIKEAKNSGFEGILTFGGAYSNHIASCAAACRHSGLKSIGIIRGEEAETSTLLRARENGMSFRFVSREEYREKESIDFLNMLKQNYPKYMVVPEGGSNELGILGAGEIPEGIPDSFNTVCCAVGTGGTLAGMIHTDPSKRYIGFPVLKGVSYLNENIQKMSGSKVGNWDLKFNYHCGGYAKINSELIDFISNFYQENKIMLDPVYTGKLLLGVYKELINEYVDPEKVIAIHTGGLQGIEGMEKRYSLDLFSQKDPKKHL